MKIAFTFLLLALALAQCASEFTAANLRGTWVIENMEVNIPDMSPALIEGGQKEAYSSRYEFTEHGKVTLKSNSLAAGVEGTYTLNLDSNYLKMSMGVGTDNEVQESYTLSDISANQMTWTFDMKDRGNIVFKVIKK